MTANVANLMNQIVSKKNKCQQMEKTDVVDSRAFSVKCTSTILTVSAFAGLQHRCGIRVNIKTDFAVTR